MYNILRWLELSDVNLNEKKYLKLPTKIQPFMYRGKVQDRLWSITEKVQPSNYCTFSGAEQIFDLQDQWPNHTVVYFKFGISQHMTLYPMLHPPLSKNIRYQKNLACVHCTKKLDNWTSLDKTKPCMMWCRHSSPYVHSPFYTVCT